MMTATNQLYDIADLVHRADWLQSYERSTFVGVINQIIEDQERYALFSKCRNGFTREQVQVAMEAIQKQN